MMNRLWSVLWLLSLLTLSCKKDTRDLKEVQDEEIKTFLGADISKFIKDTSGIYYQILEQPSGDEITNIKPIFYFQTIKTTDGTVLLNTDKFNYLKNYLTDIRPIGFNKTLFALVKKGGKIRSIIPSYLAYGKDGNGSILKGNALIDATFEVINGNTEETVEDTLINRYQKNLGLVFTKDPTGVYYSIINPGDGTTDVTLSSTISANYTGKYFNGAQFDASASGVPLVTTFASIIKGWQMLTKIKKGGKMRLLIPSYRAYGNKGYANIPPNTPLDFEIELADVK